MACESVMTGTTLSIAAAPAQTAPLVAPSSVIEGRGPATQQDESGTVAPGRRRWFRRDSRVPACLVSTLLHTLALLILALIAQSQSGGFESALLGRQGEPTEMLQFESPQKRDDQQSFENSLAPTPVDLSVASPTDMIVRSPLSTKLDVREMQPWLTAELQSGGAPSENTSPLLRLSGGGMAGRTPEGRIKWGHKYGATAESENAVDEALRWLAEHQRPNGSWSFDLELDPCGGRCRNGKDAGETPTPATAATGLALLAFLGAGHTHHDGEYTETVRRGIYYLRGIASETEAGLDWQRGSMYGHGIALMALSEALSMTTEGDQRDSDLVRLVSRGAWFSVIAQHDNGSWGYVPGSPGDTTLTGWQVLSLLAAKRTGAELQTNTLRDAKRFVLSTSAEKQYSFGYQGPPGKPTTTAIGLTLMLYLGESPDYTPFYDALTRLADRGPTLTNVYHDYYGTLALHHSRHLDWDRWHTKLRDHLVAKQETSGHEKGSWHFKDEWGDIGGRLYTTAMCAMTLEVYYRYLPLYAEIEDFPL